MKLLFKPTNLVGGFFCWLLLISCATTQTSKGGFYTPDEQAASSNSGNGSTKAKTIAQPKATAQTSSKASTEKALQSFSGKASWYGPGFHGKTTASGEIFDENQLTAAHRSLPLGSIVRVTNLKNDRSVVVKINDRGPFVGGRILDGSKRMAEELDYIAEGVADVRVDLLKLGPSDKLVPATKSPASVTAKNTVKPSPPAATNQQLALSGQHGVQVGAFREKENADRLEQKISASFKSLPVSSVLASDNLYHVIVGPFASRKLAEDVGLALDQKGINNFIKGM